MKATKPTVKKSIRKVTGEKIEGFADDIFSLPKKTKTVNEDINRAAGLIRRPKKPALNKKEQKKLIAALEESIPADKLHETPNPVRRKVLEKDVKNYEDKGGKVTVLKPGKMDKLKPSARGAEKNSLRKKGSKKSSGERSVRSSPDSVTLSSLLADLKIPGVVARKALRSSEIKKPGKQWIWEKSDTKAIAEVTKFLKGLQ